MNIKSLSCNEILKTLTEYRHNKWSFYRMKVWAYVRISKHSSETQPL